MRYGCAIARRGRLAGRSARSAFHWRTRLVLLPDDAATRFAAFPAGVIGGNLVEHLQDLRESYRSHTIGPMPVQKRTLSFEEDVWAMIESRASEEGTTASSVVNRAVRAAERVRAGQVAITEWEAEHGEFSDEELADADQALARALAEAQGQDAGAA